ncbi:L,D-transpeptidase [Candidatus Roizmanbacteria bacterium]|nr:L,D-transpeptidase [Candidatus Roizmanbacteria bacterium]
MRLFLPIAVISILIGVFAVSSPFSKNAQQGSTEASVALWNDGTDAFYQQILKSNGEWVENIGTAIFDNQPVESISKLKTENILAQAKQYDTGVLGLHTAPDGSEKWIEVDLSDLKLYAWEGNRKVYEFLISTGRPGYNTPTGEFRVWRKVRAQAYRGGSRERGDYYYLPNVPFSLFFGGGNVPTWKGYAIHGTYWHNDFGIKNRSSGCVNVKPEEAGLLYSWAGPAMLGDVGALNATDDNPGVKVVVHD